MPEPNDLTPLSDSEWVVLCRLCWAGGQATVSDLSSRRYRDDNVWDHKTVQIFLRRIEAKGWITSEPDPEKSVRHLFHLAIPVGDVLAYEAKLFLDRISLLPLKDARAHLAKLYSAPAAAVPEEVQAHS